ncbi:MAG: Do family serine endopeptidase [Notoacmeibacter sp.]|nr:Do family serine endopeptidase [Notoacmeibacter sp.]
MSSASSNRFRRSMMAAVAAAAIGATAGTATLSGILPAHAEAVRVESAQAPGFADVVEKVSPAVVSVRVKTDVQPVENNGFSFNLPGGPGLPGFDDLPRDHPLNRFFREFRGDGGERDFRGRDDRGKRAERRGPKHLRPTSQGSGFFISEDGFLVTNNHVIKGGQAFTVVMDDGTELDARLVGADQRTDLAVLKVDDKRKFTYVDFADDSKVRVGDWVVAVGNPFGLGGSVTAGIVSARGRDIGAGPYDDFIQIDAAVNRGNSGGPAFNLNGQVIGINTAIFSPSGGNVGIAFAIPASTAKDVVMDLMDDGHIERGWLGVQIQPVTKDIAESVGLADQKGALVSQPTDNGPALAAGVKAGDIITSVNDDPIASPRDLARKIAGLKPDTDIKVGVWRNGKAETVSVKLARMPKDDQMASLEKGESPAAPAEPGMLEDYGLTVTPSDNGKGVVITDVDPGSDAAERGLQAGDVIVSVNSNAVGSAADIEKAAGEASAAGRKAILLQVERNGANRFVALPVAAG